MWCLYMFICIICMSVYCSLCLQSVAKLKLPVGNLVNLTPCPINHTARLFWYYGYGTRGLIVLVHNNKEDVVK